eukprot:UN01564
MYLTYFFRFSQTKNFIWRGLSCFAQIQSFCNGIYLWLLVIESPQVYLIKKKKHFNPGRKSRASR